MTKKRGGLWWLMTILLWGGLLIIFGTHIGILAMGLPQDQLGGHAFLNILAGVMILGHKVIEIVMGVK